MSDRGARGRGGGLGTDTGRDDARGNGPPGAQEAHKHKLANQQIRKRNLHESARAPAATYRVVDDIEVPLERLVH